MAIVPTTVQLAMIQTIAMGKVIAIISHHIHSMHFSRIEWHGTITYNEKILCLVVLLCILAIKVGLNLDWLVWWDRCGAISRQYVVMSLHFHIFMASQSQGLWHISAPSWLHLLVAQYLKRLGRTRIKCYICQLHQWRDLTRIGNKQKKTLHLLLSNKTATPLQLGT